MKSLHIILLSLAVLLLLDRRHAFAQVKDSLTGNALLKDSLKVQEKTHFIIGITCNSGMNYYGRVDSLKSKGLYPFIGLELRSGLYFNTTFIFIHNSLLSQYAATIAEGGYNFRNKKGSWAGNIAADAYFYQDKDLVQSAVREAFTASLTNLNQVIDITLGINAKLSNQLDYGAQGSLDHIIRFTHIFGKGVIVLDPTATAYAGTQNFIQTYYQKKDFLFFPVADQPVTQNSQSFNILAYECSFPIVYGYKKLNLILTPAYILPQHILSVPGQPALSERASNLFYLTATARITL